MRIVGLALIACLIAPAPHASVAFAAEPATVPVQAVRLAAHTWYVEGDTGPVSLENQGFNANAGFVVTPEGVVVFDALGTPALGEALLAAIRRVTALPVRRVILSHFHADHVYGAQVFQDAGAEIWAHAAAKPYLASDAPAARLAERRRSLAPWIDEAARVVTPDVWIEGDTQFRLGGITFRLIHAGPAHTPEDLVMLVEADGVVFAGDLMFAGRIPFVGDADSRQWLAAIGRLEGMRPSVLVGGHGSASRDAGADLRLTREYLLALREAMGNAARNMIPFDEAYAATDWSRFSSLPAFEAANRRNAYNTYLLMERELLSE
jgi:glyoxylase-like metal-dependent hydrolase (beta-lactamase superfamily II)